MLRFCTFQFSGGIRKIRVPYGADADDSFRENADADANISFCDKADADADEDVKKYADAPLMRMRISDTTLQQTYCIRCFSFV